MNLRQLRCRLPRNSNRSGGSEHVIEFPVMPKPSTPLLFEDEQTGSTKSYDTVLDLSQNGKAVDEGPGRG